MSAYQRTQRGILHVLLLSLGVLHLVGGLAVFAWQVVVGWVLVVAGCLLLGLAFVFRDLTVEDRGDHLFVAFGPLRLFRRRLRYAEIRSAERSRTGWIDGLGLHYLPGRGWTWNVAGSECVELRLRDGGVFRVGTDDSEGLAAFLDERLSG